MMTPKKFTEYLQENHISWDAEKAQKFDLFFEYLTDINQRLNLTRITKRDAVYIKHFLDSITILSLPLSFKKKSVCDVGSGGGFPGIPLAIMEPSLHVTSVESTGKKVKFQMRLVDHLSLSNVDPLHARIETVQPETLFDYVTSRAVAQVSILVELTYRLLKPGGSMIFLKGPKLDEELNGSEEVLKRLQLEKSIYPIHIDEITRFILVLKKTHDVPLKPRVYGSIKKNPLW